MSEQALSGIKVIEYADFISGPFCTKLMADLGAEVIKIENSPIGDSARRTEPFLNDNPHPEKSGLFLYLNTNKRSITLNLKTQRGAEIFKELIKTADVLVENWAPSTMNKLGLGYESLNKLNHKLIMTSITPFGQTGPYSHFKGDDLTCWHMSGLAYHTPMGGVNNLDTDPPLKPGGRQSDFIAGSTAAIATMFAFIACQATGEGQYVDISQQESIACFLRQQIPYYTYDPTGVYQKWYGNRKSWLRGIGYLPCKNGYVVCGCREEYQWRSFLTLAVGQDWEQDERFRVLFMNGFDLYKFLDEFGSVRPIVIEWTMKHDKEEITALAQAKEIPIVPANSVEDLSTSPQFAERDFFVEIEHPCGSELRYPGAPYKLSRTPWQIGMPAPLIGQHNKEILCGRLGYTSQDLVMMRESGVI
ncbi:MAG: CoA transferase [Dehalococcoidales bacterium]|nr:CoA transferase [Dehalococcoidales bacterium]